MEGNTLQVDNSSVSENTEKPHGKAEKEAVAQFERIPVQAAEISVRQTPSTRQDGDATELEDERWSFRIRLGVAILAFLWLMAMGAIWSHADDSVNANDQASSARRDSNDNGGEYSFRWLDPEKKIYVLQNRRYTKADKTFVSFLAGPGLSNSYRNTFSVEPRLAYYFSESFGVEAFFDKAFNSQNNTYQAMISTGTHIFPIIREIESSYGILAQWVPWYAKINVFNSILYFDWYFEGGAGSVNTQVSNSTSDVTDFTSQSELALYAGTGHLFHLNDTFTVRLDFMGTYYHAPIAGTTGSSVWFANYNVLIGLGARL